MTSILETLSAFISKIEKVENEVNSAFYIINIERDNGKYKKKIENDETGTADMEKFPDKDSASSSDDF